MTGRALGSVRTDIFEWNTILSIFFPHDQKVAVIFNVSELIIPWFQTLNNNACH